MLWKIGERNIKTQFLANQENNNDMNESLLTLSILVGSFLYDII